MAPWVKPLTEETDFLPGPPTSDQEIDRVPYLGLIVKVEAVPPCGEFLLVELCTQKKRRELKVLC